MLRSRHDRPRLITDSVLRKWPLPDPTGEGSKEARGRVLVIAGAVEMPGAAILASTAALRAGAGKVRVATAGAAALAVATAVPELFVLEIADAEGRREETLSAVIESAANTDVVLIGPGIRDTEAVTSLLPRLLKIDQLRGLIIDATALRRSAPLLGENEDLSGRIILTPHVAEMAAMMELEPEQVEKDPLATARRAARRFGGIVALKGAETYICGDGTAYLNKRGNVGLATAGSGDVLAGIVGGLCARGASPLQAAVWAVSLHARAGERLAKRQGKIGYLARELLDEIPALLERL